MAALTGHFPSAPCARARRTPGQMPWSHDLIPEPGEHLPQVLVDRARTEEQPGRRIPGWRGGRVRDGRSTLYQAGSAARATTARPLLRRGDVPVESTRGRRDQAGFAAQAATASRMTPATASRCDKITKCEAPSISVTFEPARS